MRITFGLGLAGLAVVRLAAQDFSSVFPALKALPAPPGIEEGVRLSYYGSVGDLPGADAAKWDGEAGTWNYATAPSGHGYTQVDVVALSQGLAVLSLQGWSYSDWTGPLIPIRGGRTGLVGYAGGGDWWIHPQVLAQIPETNGVELVIRKATQVLDGVSYPAIRIQQRTERSRQASVYDLGTGRLLFKNSAVQTGKTTFASQIFYRGSRKLPGAARPSALPGWITTGLSLEYNGRYTAQVAGSAPFSLPLQALVEIQATGSDWFLYRQTTTLSSLQGLPPTVETATLVNDGSLYIPPDVLNALQPGAVLDTDPITGSRLAVLESGETVTMRISVGEVSITDLRFDATSGLLTGFRSWDRTDPLYQLESEVDLKQPPDFNAGASPTLRIGRRGRSVVLTCLNGGARRYWVEASLDGGAWQTVGQLDDAQAWETAMEPARACVTFRLRL